MKSQFYLMENPKTVDITDQYIFHAKKPHFIAQIISFQDEIEMLEQNLEGDNITFFYINSDGIREIYTLVVIEDFASEEPDRIYSKLKRMADWWNSYLVWEDQEQGKRGGHSGSLPDFNEQCPGLKIIYSSTSFKWCVIYRGIIRTFYSEPEMEDYLIKKLNFTDEQLKEGKITRI